MRRIALVHDNFAQMRGAERVAEAFLKILPTAQLHSTLTAPEHISAKLQQASIQTTWMQYLPKPERYFRQYMMFYPFAVESMRMKGYDLILSNCQGFAKGVRKDEEAIHVCYCHGPMPWVWRQEEYAARMRLGGFERALLPALTRGVKRWDLRAAQRPDYFIAASRAAARRIKEIYRRESLVIPPPIDASRFTPGDAAEDLYLMLTRLDGHEQAALAIEACNRLRKRLVIIGDGKDRERLQRLAGPTIKFFGRQPNSVVEKYARRCTALIYTGTADYAKAPLEINAAGRPVIVPRGSGVADFVIEGRTGLFFDAPSVASLVETIQTAEGYSWDSRQIRSYAEQFDHRVFNERIVLFLRKVTPWMWKPATTKDGVKLMAA